MSQSYNIFLDKIHKFKVERGLQRYDDEFRKSLWLPLIQFNLEEFYLLKLRQKWTQTQLAESQDSSPEGAGTPLQNSLQKHEKPTRHIKNGRIVGVADPVPLYLRRGPPTSAEFQGARLGPNYPMGPHYPCYMPEKESNYLRKKFSSRHRQCMDVNKTPATVWRDLMSSTLSNETISGIKRYYNPLTESADERFESRWPIQRKLSYPDEYFEEHLKLHSMPSLLFIPNWIDEQIVFPYADHTKKCNNARNAYSEIIDNFIECKP